MNYEWRGRLQSNCINKFSLYGIENCIYKTNQIQEVDVLAWIYAGSVKGSYSKPSVTLDVPINLVSGENKIDLLSLTVGLQVKTIICIEISQCQITNIL